ncbi:MAG: two-component system, OmpR family, sensor histidine kinase BaeS [Solirubrobacteraceae bacterium]|nr:two-component system, OmpR family, sensor histidine kinase BaeS [Solirubrobacteraceae bacterium]
MSHWRPFGVRAHLLGAMVGLALASVAVTAVIVNRAVDSELGEFSKRDLRITAVNAADTAAAVYLEDGGWSERSVLAMRTVLRAHGEAIVVLGANGRPVPGSPSLTRPGGEHATVFVHGRGVGTVIATPLAAAGIESAARRLDGHLRGRMNGLLVTAGVLAASLALLLALLVAVRVARPLQRLTEVARRMGAGEIETRATGAGGGGREIARLAHTMDRLAAALRRQDELRRATASDVTHELRGALVGVFARVEGLRDGVLDDEQAALAALDGDVRRLHRLVDDVDRLAEAQRPGLLVSKRPIDLDEIVLASVARYADRCTACSVAVREHVSRARVEGDPERLAQVVDNLLSNALRYTGEGGRITVTLAARGDDAVIAVSDTGIGIAPEHLERIFDRFWRAPEARAVAAGGSGVGLALVAELVRAHDGCVDVASRPGRGTTFSVRLPLSEHPLAAAPASRRAPAPAPLRWPAPVPELWLRRGDIAAGVQPDAPATR